MAYELGLARVRQHHFSQVEQARLVMTSPAVTRHESAAPKLTVGEIEAHFARDFPQGDFGPKGLFKIERVGMGSALVRMRASDSVLRPGGTVSGSSMMTLADATMYVAILASIGWVPLAVTTSLNINFLKKPKAGDVLADCKLLKLGKRLTVGEIAIRSEGEEEMVAHSTATYSIPPQG